MIPTSSQINGPNTTARIGVFLALVSVLISSSLPSPLYPSYQHQLGLSAYQISVVFSMYATGVIFALLLLSAIGDKFKDRRSAIIFSLLALAGSSLIMAFASTSTMLIVGRFISGFSTGALTGSATAALFELHPRKDARASAMLSTLAITLGSGSGPIFSGALLRLEYHPESLSFFCITFLALLSLVLVAFHSMPVPGHASKAALTESKSTTPNHAVLLFMLSALTLIIGWGIGSVFMSSGPLLLQKQFSIQNSIVISALLTGFQFIAGVGQIIGARFKPLSTILFGCSGIVLFQVIMGYAVKTNSTEIYILAILITGLCYGVSFIGSTTLISTLSNNHNRARNASLYFVCGYLLGNAFPAAMVGKLTDNIGITNAMACFSTIVALIAVGILVLTLFLRRKETSTLCEG